MKKYLLIFLSLLLVSCKSVKPDYILNQDVVCDGLYNKGGTIVCKDMQGNLVSGLIIGYYTNGNISAELTVKDGMPNGNIKLYYENKKLQRESVWQNGVRQGVQKEYYENGALSEEIQFKNNEISGNFKKYSKEGKLKGLYQETDKTAQKGTLTMYYDNGNVQGEYTIVKGEKNGPAKEFYSDGVLQRDLNYKNDQQEGSAKSYYRSGNIHMDANFKNGKLDGILKEYYDNKELKSETKFVNGEQKGDVKEYKLHKPATSLYLPEPSTLDTKSQPTTTTKSQPTKNTVEKKAVAPSTEMEKYEVTARVLKVRSGPDKSYSEIGKLSRGDIIKGAIYDSSWLQVTHRGKTGYISRQYVKKYHFDLFSTENILIAIAIAILIWAIREIGKRPWLIVLVIGGMIWLGVSDNMGINYWIIAFVLSGLIIAANGISTKCEKCGKWWARFEVSRRCIEERPCSITKTNETRDRNGNVLFTSEVTVPGTEYTDEVVYRCRYCGNEDIDYEFHRYEN